MSSQFQTRLRNGTASVICCFVLALLASATHLASGSERAVPLGRASGFAVLAGTSLVSTGASVILGNVGVWPGTDVVGFPPGTFSGTLHTGNVAAADGQTDLTTAFNDAAARPPRLIISGDIGGLTFTSGVYQSSSTLDISSGDLTLNALGNSNAVFIFQIASTLTVAPDRGVVLAGGARAARIFWQVGDSATLGTNSSVKGNILAEQSIDVRKNAVLVGRALVRSSAVTMENSYVQLPPGGPGPAPSGLVEVESLTPVTLNPQTGLLEQMVRVRNAGSNAVAAVQLVLPVLRLPADASVYNATGRLPNGRPFIQYNVPLAVDDSVELVIEYFRANRQPFEFTNFVANAAGPFSPVIAVEARQAVVRAVPLGGGRTLVEFTATRGRRYAVQYNDGGYWKTAYPPVTAMANRVMWLDEGPPKTEGRPPDVRAYRILKLP